MDKQKMSYSDYYQFNSTLRSMEVDYPRDSKLIPKIILRKAQELNLMIEGALASADWDETEND